MANCDSDRLPACSIRVAVLEDIPVLADLQVRAWQETYGEWLPAGLLEKAVMDREFEEMWRVVLKYAGKKDRTFLLLDGAGEAAGFASAGPARENDLGHDQEVYALYLLRRIQGQGYGRILWQSVRDHLNSGGFYLWSLCGNPTGQFYEHFGGKAVASRRARWRSWAYVETAYEFEALEGS